LSTKSIKEKEVLSLFNPIASPVLAEIKDRFNRQLLMTKPAIIAAQSYIAVSKKLNGQESDVIIVVGW